MKKKMAKVFSVLLAVVMLVTIIPQTAFAAEAATSGEEENGNSVTINLSINKGINKFVYTEESDKFLIPQELTIPYFDLDLYGLADYYYNPNCYDEGQTVGTQESAEGVVTVLHAYIYATEVFYCGMEPEEAGKGKLYSDNGNSLVGYLEYSGGVGSFYMTNFWNEGYNLNYYINYVYPLGSTGWGATADQIALNDGDVVTIHLIEDENVWGSKFSFFTANDEDGEFGETDTVDKISVKQGETLSLNLYRTSADYNNSYATMYTVDAYEELYLIPEASLSSPINGTALGTTDENGSITINTEEYDPGTYYVAAFGEVDYDSNMEAGPAIFELTIMEAVNLDQQAADAVIAKINAIGEVTLESEAAITEARTAYGALTDAQKELVTNYAVLTTAEAKLAQLQQEAAEKAEKEAADKAAADAVVAKINAIGTVTLESEAVITEARTAYDALTADQKKLVINETALTAAEAALKELKEAAEKEAAEKAEKEAADKAAADAVIAKIKAIGTVTLDREEAITDARTAYDVLTEDQKDLVTNYATLTAAEETLTQLKKEAAEKEEEEKEDDCEKNGHSWEAGTVTTKATCEKAGVMTYKCKNCEATKTEVIKATGHSFKTVSTTKATTEKNGKIVKKCACGKKTQRLFTIRRPLSCLQQPIHITERLRSRP